MTIDLFFEKWGPGHSSKWAGFRSDLTELIESGGDRAVADAKTDVVKCAAAVVDCPPPSHGATQCEHELDIAVERLRELGWEPGD